MISLQFKDGKIEVEKDTLLKLDYFQGNERINSEKNEFNFIEEEFSYIGFNYILDILENDLSKVCNDYDNMITYFGIPNELNIIIQYEKRYNEQKAFMKGQALSYHFNMNQLIKKELKHKHECYWDEDDYNQYMKFIDDNSFIKFKPRYICNENYHTYCHSKYNIPLTDCVHLPDNIEEYIKIYKLNDYEKPKFIQTLIEMNNIIVNYNEYIGYNHILNIAIEMNDIQYIKYLLTKSEIIQSINKPLFYQFRERSYFHYDNGCLINLPSTAYDYVLLTAINNNHYEIIDLLLDNNADPNIINHYGCRCKGSGSSNENDENEYTTDVPLFYAIRNNNFELFKKLIEKNANIGITARRNKLNQSDQFRERTCHTIETLLEVYNRPQIKMYYDSIKNHQLNTKDFNEHNYCNYDNYLIFSE
jgi:hypothetical protein